MEIRLDFSETGQGEREIIAAMVEDLLTGRGKISSLSWPDRFLMAECVPDPIILIQELQTRLYNFRVRLVVLF